MRPEERFVGGGLVVLAAACFATLGPITRFAAEAGVEPLPLITWRAAIGAAFLALFVGFRAATGGAGRLRWSGVPGRARWFMLGGVVAGALVNFGVFLAFVRISIALTLLIFYLYPTLVAVASAARFGEPFDRFRSTALVASLVGLILVFAGAGDLGALDLLGVGLAFLAALAQMFYVLAARHGFAAIPSGQAASITLGGGALLYLVLAAAVGTLPAIGAPLADTSRLVIVGFAGTVGAGVPTLAFLVGIRRLGPPRAAILATLEPVIAVILAAALLAEVPTGLQLLGGGLVIVGAALSQLSAPLVAVEHEAVGAGPE